MQKNSRAGVQNPLLLCMFIIGLMAALVFVPYQFNSSASGKKVNKGLFQRTESHEEGLENYDIRADKAASEKIAGFRQTLNKDAATVADIRSSFVSGEDVLRTKVPTLKVEYNTDIRTPEVIAPDVKQGRNFLTGGSSTKRSEILRSFVKENNSLIGVSDTQADNLKVTADYTNPDGNLSFAHLEQFIGGIPVFRGEVKAGFTKGGEMIRVINNLAPGLDYESLSTDFRNPADAVKAAAGYINYDLKSTDTAPNAAASTDLKTVFGEGDWATTAEKMYFPTEPGVAVPAWRVLIWEPVNAYYVIVDANSGTMLWRKNITNDQTQSATYQVYTNSNAMINSAENPAPLTPGPINPTLGTQGAIIARTNVTRIGNEAPYTFNNNGWVTDGTNVTDGNNLQAGIDRDGVNGVDATQVGSPNRVFDSTWNPPPGSPAPGDDPLTAQAQRGAVIQMFYVMNLYHDELYRLGFTEAARNFQGTNFTGQGVGNDRVSAEGQDSSGTNNANFSTPADGGRGRMQMYLWTGPTPDYDGTTDGDVIIHEVTHGTSNRLHGNASGLSTNMSGGMGEGWGDFYAHALLSEPSDPINGVYTEGGYATYLASAGFTGNYYYGIRRFPKAVMAFTGGPNNRPHNPLTFADADSTQFNISDGAFARGPFGSATVDQVHNLGEIWSSALWEVRAKLVTRLGWAVGNRKALQFVTDGMKLAPLGPTFLQERDAIIAAAQASSVSPQAGPDVADVWAGFAIRGMGASAVVTAAGSGANNTRVTEAFDLPNLVQTPTFTVSDSTGDNDGFPEPGETITLTIPLTNNTGNDATGTTLQVVGGGTANYGTITNGTTVSRSVTYTVPANTPCGSALTLTFNVNSSLGATSFTRTIIIGVPQTTFTENFDGVTAPTFPAGWTAVSVSSGINFVNSPLNPDTPANSAFAADPLTVGGGSDLTSPSIPISAQAATVSFRNRFDTEAGWDGGVLEISINGGAFQDIISAGGRFIENGYTGVLGANGANNPLAGRNAWNGLSGGYITSTVQLPAAAAGQNVQLKWRFGGDDNTAGQGANPGWYVDTIRVNGNYACSVTSVKSRADFDGDGKTDLSVFRPSEGNWYLNRSTAGFTVANWGVSTDVLTPGDYDGDGKADLGIFRPSTGQWYILRSSDGGFSAPTFGASGDIPVQGDYDGDGKADIAVFRPSTNVWYISNSGGGSTITAFGASGDIPVRGDYDGDGKTDIAIYRAGAWWIARSTGGVSVTNFGNGTDKAVPADYDGDNKDDVAVYRPSEGKWYILRSSNGAVDFITFGLSTDIPVPGDYDGDGKDDTAVYRNGTWWLNQSTAGVVSAAFGLSTDTAIPTRYIP
ncbi:MAG TPA: M36 family metallopeptidase [Pyrinomonadaceae bacterium]|nr:M36 family metallopeptidase [Pyrinomonadaceae bacterium]